MMTLPLNHSHTPSSPRILRSGLFGVLLGGILAATAPAQAATLKFVEAHFDDAGLYGVFATVVSPDGTAVIATSVWDNTLVAFQRDANTGRLLYVTSSQKDGIDGVDGLDGARAAAFSPDGQYVYAVGADDDAVAVFRFNSGVLTFVETERYQYLDGPSAVAVSPDGTHVYVGSAETGYIHWYSRNATTGQLSFINFAGLYSGGTPVLQGIRSLAFSPDGSTLYAAAFDTDTVAAFSRNATTGDVTTRQTLTDGTGGVDGLDGAYSVTVSPDGKHVYVAAWNDNAVAVFSRNATTGALTFVEVQKDGVNGVDGLSRAASVVVSPDGAHVYVAGCHDSAVTRFTRDATTGRLTWNGLVQDGQNGVDGLNYVRAVTLSPDGSSVYAAGSGEDAVAVFTRTPDTGALAFIQVRKDTGIDCLDAPASIALSPDGAHVYVAARNDDALAVFRRDAATQHLTFVEYQQDGRNGVNGLDGTRSVAVSPDGTHVYAAGEFDNAVTIFSRNATTGALTFVGLVQDGGTGGNGLSYAIAVTVSPNGQQVYAASYLDDAITVFGRNATTGGLTFAQLLRDGEGSIDGLDGAYDVAVSPDGAYVYVASDIDNALVAFRRNAATGQLTFVQSLKDGVGGVNGLANARSVAVSADNAHVYVAGSGDDAVAVFARHPTTGDLTFVEILKHGINGVDGLETPIKVAVSPDGTHVYATGSGDNSVAVFRRDAATGRLTFVAVLKDGLNGVDGLMRPWGIAVSPDNAAVYAAGYAADAVAVFRKIDEPGISSYLLWTK